MLTPLKSLVRTVPLRALTAAIHSARPTLPREASYGVRLSPSMKMVNRAACNAVVKASTSPHSTSTLLGTRVIESLPLVPVGPVQRYEGCGRFKIPPSGSVRREDLRIGAEERTRTFTVLPPPAPQAGASANSATSAWVSASVALAGRAHLKMCPYKIRAV